MYLVALRRAEQEISVIKLATSVPLVKFHIGILLMLISRSFVVSYFYKLLRVKVHKHIILSII